MLQLNVNESPTSIALTSSNVDEGVAGRLVGTFTCTDPENSVCAYTLQSGTALFQIIGAALYTRVAIDRAQYPAVALQVQAADSGVPVQTRTQSFTIVINAVVRAPGVSDTAMSIAENSGTGAYVGVFANSQPSAQLSFAMLSATPTTGLTVFSLQACSGAFYVAQVREWRPGPRLTVPPPCPVHIRRAAALLFNMCVCARAGLTQ